MEPSKPPLLKRALASFLFGLNTSSLLFTVTAVPFVLVLLAGGVRTLPAFVIGCFPIASAAVAFAIVCLMVPGLVFGNKLRFPLNFTLPVVYVGLILVMSEVMGSLRTPVAMLGDEPRVDQFWSMPLALFVTLVVQIGALSLASAINRRKELGA